MKLRWYIYFVDEWQQERSGPPRAGGKSRKVSVKKKKLQYLPTGYDESESLWRDVPEVSVEDFP